MIKSHSKEGRKAERKKLGSLKSLTVQPRTRERYSLGLQSFFDFLKLEGLELPSKRDHMDALVGDYLEHLWADGEGRAAASNFLAALQDFDPKLRGQLPMSWRLMRTCATNEVPNRALPLTEAVLKAMVGWAFFHEHHKFGLSLLVAFYGLLRTGELLGLQAWQVHMTSSSQPAVLSLGLTKSGKRQGAAESVTLTEKPVLQLLWQWKANASTYEFLTPKPHVWRQLFQECLEGLKLQEWNFRPYSLRRGGATSFFVKVGVPWPSVAFGPLDSGQDSKNLFKFRTGHACRSSDPSVSTPSVSLSFWQFPSLHQTLEHALSSRSGGRGKSLNSAMKKAMKRVKSEEREELGVSYPFCPFLSWVQVVFPGLAGGCF